MTDTATRPDVQPVTSDGSHDAYAHIVGNVDQMAGYVLGAEIVALCGKRWTPGLNPDGLRVCPECSEIAERLGPTEALRRLDQINRRGAEA